LIIASGDPQVDLLGGQSAQLDVHEDTLHRVGSRLRFHKLTRPLGQLAQHVAVSRHLLAEPAALHGFALGLRFLLQIRGELLLLGREAFGRHRYHRLKLIRRRANRLGERAGQVHHRSLARLANLGLHLLEPFLRRRRSQTLLPKWLM
jgi:hypothetical protein